MSGFLSNGDISSELIYIIKSAKEYVWLVSPYIKLHHSIKSALNDLKNKPEVALIVVFGKNEENVNKSFAEEEISYFKEFPNVEILYEPRLHAKYYANEIEGLITSMNLYAFSFNENKEVGVVLDTKTKEKADDFFKSLIRDAELKFKKKAHFEAQTSRFSSIFSLKEDYVNSEVEVDVFRNKTRNIPEVKSRVDLKTEIISKKEDVSVTTKFGYCIRTGKKIEFDLEKPFSKEAYKSWEAFQNGEYPEKYCHYSGEESKGETCFNKPVLKKNWGKWKNK